MKREDLKNLGLEDAQVDSVMELYGRSYNPLKAEKEGLETQNANLSQQIKDRDQQLEDLRKQAGSDAELQKKYDDLIAENKASREEMDKQIASQALNHAVEIALMKNKAKNLKAAKALLNFDALKLNDDKTVDGLDKQIEEVIKENDFLFGSDRVYGSDPAGAEGGSPQDGLIKDLAKGFSKQSGGALDW